MATAVSPSRALTKDDRHARTLASLAFAGSTLPGAIQYLSQSHRSLLASDTSVRTPLASQAGLAVNVLIVLFALYVTMSRGFNIHGHAGDLVLILAIFAWSLLGLWRENNVTGRELIDYITVGLVVLALWCLRPSRRLYAHIGRLVSVLVIYSLIFGLADPAGAYYTSLSGAIGESTKALIGDNQLASVFGHSNTLGIAVAVGVPFILHLERRSVRIVMFGLATWVMVWSASRTALFAASFALVIVVILKWLPRKLARPAVWAVSLVTFAMVFVLPLRTSDPNAYTRRGAIWIGSLAESHQSLFFGQGPNWYYNIAQFDNELGAQASSGHNWFVSTLVVGGAIGLILGVFFLLRLLATFAHGSADMPAAFTAYWFWISIIALSTLEYIWVSSPRGDLFFSVTFLTFVVLRVEALAKERPEIEAVDLDRSAAPALAAPTVDGIGAGPRPALV